MTTMTRDGFNLEALRSRERELTAVHAGFRSAGLSLDLTRGKPSPAQLALSDDLDAANGPLAAADGTDVRNYGGLDGLPEARRLGAAWLGVRPDEVIAGGNSSLAAADGTDVRNYGGLDGLPEARRLGAAWLGVRPDEVIAGGNSSLTLMYLYLLNAWLHGPAGPGTAWRESGPVRFLCPVPGYDRHFAILEDLGIEMINVPMRDDGPDMDLVEEQVRSDASIRGIWCVPKYSNPGGQVYSEATIDRLARLAAFAGPHFRILCDNAYAFHDMDDEPPRSANVMDACRRHHTEDGLVLFASTSKVTRAGAGICFMGGSPATLDWFQRRMQVVTIGPDKVNQLRHVRFLRDLDHVRAHMRRHAAILRPKFDLVFRRLSEALGGTGTGSWTTPPWGLLPFVRRPPRSGPRDCPTCGPGGREAHAGRRHVPV